MTFLSELYMNVFGTTEFLGINLGFWFLLIIVALVVLFQNVFFWTRKPYAEPDGAEEYPHHHRDVDAESRPHYPND